MKLTWSGAKSVTIYVLGLASVIIGAIPAVEVSGSVHAALVAVGGVVIAVERYLQGQVAIAASGRAGVDYEALAAALDPDELHLVANHVAELIES